MNRHGDPSAYATSGNGPILALATRLPAKTRSRREPDIVFRESPNLPRSDARTPCVLPARIWHNRFRDRSVGTVADFLRTAP